MSPSLASVGITLLVSLETKFDVDIGFSVCAMADQTILPLLGLQRLVSNFTN